MKNLRLSLTLPLLVLLVLALLTFWIERYVQAPQESLSRTKTHDPDYFMENFVSSKTDKNGKLKTILVAVKLEHFSDDDSLHMMRPRLTQFNATGGYSQIEAQRGIINGDGDVAEFFDHVIFHKPANNDSDMHLYTSYLKVLPDKNIASTPEQVRITQGPNSYMTGIGMVYNKDHHEITLHKKVKIHYLKGNTGQLSSKPSDRRRAKSIKKNRS